MNRLGAILVPMLGGFVLTFAWLSWRCGWWQHPDAFQSAAATQSNIEVRRPDLRIVQVNVSAIAAAKGFAASTPPTASAAPAPTSEAPPKPAPDAVQAAPYPRAESGPPEAPARKFARGSRQRD